MKREDRRQSIMDLLVTHGAVDLEDLADRYAVSKMTIHRDLDDLEYAGLLRKIRGGATIEAGTRFESDFRLRERQALPAKKAIAEAALELVEPAMTVMVNDGSTAALLGSLLVKKRPLTVITNNAAVLDVLKNEAGITLISLGGAYSAKYNGFFGKVTEDSLSELRADVAFISSPAVSGTEVFHMDETVAKTKRAMMTSGAHRCLLVNHSRFGHTALHKMAELNEFDAVITDRMPSRAASEALENIGMSLTIARAEASQ